jgi:hypothetical protein
MHQSAGKAIIIDTLTVAPGTILTTAIQATKQTQH